MPWFSQVLFPTSSASDCVNPLTVAVCMSPGCAFAAAAIPPAAITATAAPINARFFHFGLRVCDAAMSDPSNSRYAASGSEATPDSQTPKETQLEENVPTSDFEVTAVRRDAPEGSPKSR